MECFEAAALAGNPLALGRIAQYHQVRSQFAEPYGYWDRLFVAIFDRSQPELDILEPASTIFDFLKTRGMALRWLRKTLDPYPISAARLGAVIRTYQDGLANLIAAKRRTGRRQLSADAHLGEARAYEFIARCFERRI